MTEWSETTLDGATKEDGEKTPLQSETPPIGEEASRLTYHLLTKHIIYTNASTLGWIFSISNETFFPFTRTCLIWSSLASFQNGYFREIARGKGRVRLSQSFSLAAAICLDYWSALLRSTVRAHDSQYERRKTCAPLVELAHAHAWAWGSRLHGKTFTCFVT